MHSLPSKFRLLSAAAVLPLLSACPGSPPQPLSRQIDPEVRSIALIEGQPDAVQSCQGPIVPAPQSWWNSLPPQQPPKLVNQGLVGFHLTPNPRPGCAGFRQDLYRTEFGYSLLAQQALKGLVVKAMLSVHAEILPPQRPGFLCEPFTGGGGGLVRLSLGQALPAAAFTEMPATARVRFLSGARRVNFPQPWISGSLPGGATSFDGGGQRASFSVDVTQDVVQALDNGAGAIQFAIAGSDEAVRSAAPPAAFDCRTIYRVGPLVLTHY
ncbi:hypothetical protein HNQ51_001357 [Inhella inkyongensis]|uniref:Lipoprotein n=1 Tax=Inhella inkyongensis TaxID=392593 RepID=A0A840S5H2_9BURK|nr:hypothetical protein [Inhella inkyongensis]MBB5204064.1 hypothetical protein [Inhella inkyongensis]